MTYGGIYHFRDSELGAIESTTRGQLEACREIWGDVQRELLRLVDEGKVDASVGEILRQRDETFRTESSRFDEGVEGQNTAVQQVRQHGAEGGEAMRRAAAGR
ncbi:hypothetical protein [Streptomyces radicis]|uniref:Uncharacterized protein n=1 Tax=Streptomyces radicis TaxID=1750517 RepID=A0A3A9WD19_9ACTN|nr:hypothetical protein [Streptomyces radicis]RKN10978.1 hypothetical protein D7319_07545 [Streptomyces radicis]RKN25241.1 hypothetical protein D7318_08400 [Streptomyces radicis]